MSGKRLVPGKTERSDLKFGRFTIPVITIAALVLVGAVAAGFVVNAVVTSDPPAENASDPTLVPKPAAEPTATSTSVPVKLPEPTAELAPAPTPIPALPVEATATPTSVPLKLPEPTAEHTPAPTPTPTLAVEPTATPTSVPLNIPEAPGKLQPPSPANERSAIGTRSESSTLGDETVVQPKSPELTDKSQQPATPPDRSAKGTDSGGNGAGQGKIYTWEDGDRTLRAVLQEDLVVQDNAANTPDDVVVARGAGDSIVRKQPKHGEDPRPVFRSESGGGLMTLPGGVLLALDPEWDEDMVDSFFSENGISKDRTSELGFIENGFVVETEPGFSALELANELAAQDGVVISSPNWWREVETK